MHSKFKNSPAGHILRSVCFLLLFVLLFQAVCGVLRGQPGTGSNAAFYEAPPRSLDVLFMGSSHMLNAVSPMQLWEEHGIPSSNLALNGQVLPVTYYALQEALRYQKPKVVVLDIYKAVQDSLIDSPGALHTTLDGMRFGLPKIQAAFDLMPEGQRAEYIFDIIIYHERWKLLSETDSQPPDTVQKGAQALFAVTPPYDGWTVLPAEETAPPAQIQLEYLEKIVALCQREDVPLLLVAVPFTTPENDDLNRQAVVNGMAAYAEEWGLPYLNMMQEVREIGFDFSTDMSDMYHVNWRGMEKVTAALGDYLARHYDLPDRRGEPAYQSWEMDLPAYHAYLEKQIQLTTDAETNEVETAGTGAAPRTRLEPKDTVLEITAAPFRVRRIWS